MTQTIVLDRGQSNIIGDAVLHCGSCCDVTIPKGTVDLLFVDPPYGCGNMDDDLQASRAGKVKGGRQRAAEPIISDKGEEFEYLLRNIFWRAQEQLKPVGTVCCYAAGGGPSTVFCDVLGWFKERLEFHQLLVWDKSARGNGMGWRYRRNYEFIIVGHQRGQKMAWADESVAVPNVLRHAPPKGRYHPNQKPVEQIMDFIRWHTQPGDMVYDPCMGSGSTGVACVRMGRRFIGVEADQRHYERAVERITRAQQDTSLLRHAEQPLFKG